MPESVKDRPTRSHEFIFMLTKQPVYYFDMEAVKEPVGEAMIKAAQRKAVEPGRTYQHDEESRFGKTSPNRVWSDPEAMQRLLAGRHMRDVLTIPTRPYAGAHYAVFPPDLVTPLIKAATSEKGCCPECGSPWKRITKTAGVTTAKGGEPHDRSYGRTMADSMDDLSGAGEVGSGFAIKVDETVGWEPTCDHEVPYGVVADEYLGGALEAEGWKPLDPVPCVVLDPFGGSGTLAMVAQQLGRRAISIDLNPTYIEQQMLRNLQKPLGL
jgi:hypothetical protein